MKTMPATRERLAALPKEALVNLALRLAHERNTWRKAMQTRDDWRHWDARQCRDAATAILAVTPPDPDAEDHLAALTYELNAGRRPVPRHSRRRPGPRCNRGVKECGKPLTDGLCSKHDARIIKALRRDAA